MKKTFYIINAILIAAILASGICYDRFGGLWLKGLTSAGFVVLGALNLIYALKSGSNDKKFSIFMVVGLALGMVADIVLNLKGLFIAGAAIFAVGHVFYVVAYCMLVKFRWTDLIACAIIFIPAALFITLAPIFDFGGILMEIVCVVYALIISLMAGKAISNLIRERNFVNLLIVIGSVLFVFSDMMLLLGVFGNNMPFATLDSLCILTYYPAQCLLAHAIMHTNSKKQEQQTEKETKTV